MTPKACSSVILHPKTYRYLSVETELLSSHANPNPCKDTRIEVQIRILEDLEHGCKFWEKLISSYISSIIDSSSASGDLLT